jgi:hypothetical protein
MHATTTLLLCIATSLPSAVLTTVEPVTLRFAPAEGSSWTRTLTATTTMEWRGMTVLMGGQPVPDEYLPEIDLVVTTEHRVVVNDQYVAMASGRPARVRRHYAEIECSAEQDFDMTVPVGGGGGEDVSDSSKGDAESVLSGRTVEFAWEEDGERFAAHWHGDAPGAPVPQRLAEDMDLRALLPARAVAVGDTWRVTGAALSSLLRPGGDLALEWPEELGDEWGKQPLEESTDGELTLTLEAVDESGGERLARIVLTGEARELQTLEGDLSQVPVVEGEATQTDKTTYELTGTLTWDLEAGLVRSLELELEAELESRTRADDPAADYEHTVRLAGSGTLKLTCTPRE